MADDELTGLARAVDQHRRGLREYVQLERRILALLPQRRRRFSPLLLVTAVLTLILPALWVGTTTVSGLRVGSDSASAVYLGSEEAWRSGVTPPVETGMATFYVAPTGSDTNAGTRTEPFRTLARARDEVRTLNDSMSGDITVYLRGGTYRQTSTLALDGQDSGSNGFTVSYAAYPGERPVISGGVAVSGWSLHDSGENIWRATVGSLETRDFFVNGQKATRARSSGDWPSGWEKTATGFDAPDSSMDSWGNQTAIELVGDNESRFYSCRVDNISGSSIDVVQPCWDNSQTPDWAPWDGVRWIENAYELLDSDGEWYLDETAGTIYYRPRPGENMASATAVAGGLETILSGSGVTDVEFSGLTFAYTSWTFPNTDAGFVGLQQGDHPIAAGWDGDDGIEMIPGGVEFTGARNVTFDRNVFTLLGGVGLTLDVGSQAVTVTGNVFDRVGNNGINLGNFDSSPPSNDEIRNITIANNYIHRIGDHYYNSAGIWGGYVADVEIAHNEIFDVPQKGVAIGWGWGETSYAAENKIHHNFVHQTTTELHDSGMFYTLSPQPGTEIYNNYGFDDVNRYNCLYPDEGTADTSWHHNVCSQIGQWLHIWTGSIRDNTVQFNYSDTTNAEREGTNNTVSDNVFIDPGDPWPAAAQDIIDAAGLEAAYQDIKNTALIP